MQRTNIQLAFAFLRTNPEKAARVLENEHAEQVALFLERTPRSDAATILHTMLPAIAADVMAYLPADIRAALIIDAPPSDMVAILHHLPSGIADALLAALPAKQQAVCRMLFAYAANTVGAWMDTDFMMARAESSVDEILKRIKKRDSLHNTETVYVVDRERHPLGVVHTHRLIRCTSGETPITALLQRTSAALTARMDLNVAKDNPLWQAQDSLPVVNRHRQAIGVLHHFKLREALSHLSAQTPDRSPLYSEIYRAYSASASALLNTLAVAVRADSGARND